MNSQKDRKIPPAPRWDLESIFPGGSESKEYASFRESIKRDIETLKTEYSGLPLELNDSSRDSWVDFILKVQNLLERVHHGMSFSHCLISQDVNDTKGHQIVGEMDLYYSEYEKLMVALEAFSKRQSDKEWNRLIENDRLKQFSFFLNEMRQIARMKMEPELEAFATDLAVNGYHAWNRLYDKMYGDLNSEFTENGETTKLSLGQLANKMAVPDRAVRKQAFDCIEEAWERRAELAAMTLNFMGGFRLTLYDKRNWQSPLTEALLNSRIKEETLEAMWSAVVKETKKLIPYIEAKKRLLGIDKFAWYDQFAPVGSSDILYSFDEAGDFIVENIRNFSPAQADFCRMALDKRWVEAEDRSGKAGGGYCTRLPLARESRIFMTFSGSFSELATLAHELGHVYHGEVLKDLPPFARTYPMTLAETASIFYELLVKDAALDKADDDNMRLMLLEQRLQDTFVLFCNLYARFIFDKAFYKERKSGLVSRERLDELMLAAQKEAFAGMLDGEIGYHSLFWASKLHFFLSDTPFYNYPYTFGFLFANGVYSRARQEGAAFADKYNALLRDTGCMTSEDVAKKHLGVDLTKEDFWSESVALALDDVDPFVKLVDEVKK
jgi:pepF/M3 family oligoendopeptidase